MSKRCPNCIDWIDSRVGNPKYDGYCATCFKRIFPDDIRSTVIHTNSREIRVRNAISQRFDGFIHNKPIYTTNCECTHRRRIDHRKLINNTILAIETDEFSHQYYDKKDEEIRYDDLYMIHSGKWIFIRFNPDKTSQNDTDFDDRLIILLEEIQRQIERIEKEENNELVEIIKLFYGNSNDKYEKYEKSDSDSSSSNSDKIFTCVICEKTFATKQTLTYHTERNVCKPKSDLSCIFCNKIFCTKQSLDYHVKNDVCKPKDEEENLKFKLFEVIELVKILQHRVSFLENDNKILKEETKILKDEIKKKK